MMKTNVLKGFLLGWYCLTLAPNVYAEEWKMINRYQVKEGLAKDVSTGLIWMRCSLGQNWNSETATCEGEAAKLTWDQAMDVSKNFEYGKYSDWRLPTSEELKTLVYCSSGKTKPYKKDSTACIANEEEDEPSATIAKEAFPETVIGWFWSSTAYAYGREYAWFVDFQYGYDDFSKKTDLAAVRLVRKSR